MIKIQGRRESPLNISSQRSKYIHIKPHYLPSFNSVPSISIYATLHQQSAPSTSPTFIARVSSSSLRIKGCSCSQKQPPRGYLGIGGLAITELSKHPREGTKTGVKFKTRTERIKINSTPEVPALVLHQTANPGAFSTAQLSEKSSNQGTGGHRGNSVSDNHGVRGHGRAGAGRGRGRRSSGFRRSAVRRRGGALGSNLGLGGVKFSALVLDRRGAVVLLLFLTCKLYDADVECLLADELLEQAN